MAELEFNDIEFLLQLNEKLCDLVDVILLYYDPCKFGVNKCLVTDDIEGSDLHCCNNRYGQGLKCPFLKSGTEPCKFRNISCKLWLCATAIENSPECVESLKDLEKFALRYGLTKRPLLGQRYVGMSAELAAVRARSENKG